jgi:hypothetical protein
MDIAPQGLYEARMGQEIAAFYNHVTCSVNAPRGLAICVPFHQVLSTLNMIPGLDNFHPESVFRGYRLTTTQYSRFGFRPHS